MLKDTVKKRLGYMVKNEREHLRLSQSALAEQAGVSIRTISDIETCNGNPELATLIPLAQYLKISLDAIIHEAPLESNPKVNLNGFFFSTQSLLCCHHLVKLVISFRIGTNIFNKHILA